MFHSSSQSTSTSNSSSSSDSNNSTIKDGWGSRSNFQASYGLKMDPEGFAEGNAIRGAFREQDRRHNAK